MTSARISRCAGLVTSAVVVLLLAGCNGAERDAADVNPDPTALPDTMEIADAPVFRYVCPDGEEFSVQYRNGIARLILPDTSVDLTRQEDGSEARYALGDYDLQSSGPQATLSTPEWSSVRCSSEHEGAAAWSAARARGVDLRAVGQEPAWLMEVFGDERIVLTLDYGQEEHEFEDVEISTDASHVETIYRATSEEGDLEVHVVAEPCQDIMSGEPFAASVTVNFEGRELEGCGRALQ